MTEQNKPVPLNTLDVLSNWMYSEPVAGATKRPSFRIRVIRNVPRFTVKTNVPNDKNNGRIDFNCDVATFSVIMSKLEELAEGKSNESFNFNYVDHIFTNGQRSEKPVVQSTVKIGKDQESGKIYIAVLGYNRPKIQFFFGPSQYHRMVYGDGSEVKESVISAAYTVGFVKTMVPLVCGVLVNQFDEDAKNVPKMQPMGQGVQQDRGRFEQRPAKPKQESSFEESFDNFEDVIF